MIEMGMWKGKERRKPRIYDGTYLTLKNLSNQKINDMFVVNYLVVGRK